MGFRAVSVNCALPDILYNPSVISALETDRLLLRPLELSDAERIQELFPHWEIVRYINNRVPWPYPADGAHTFCQQAVEAAERSEQWHWSMRLKEQPDQLIGVVSLMTGEENRGFWIGTPWQRRGLTAEAADAVTHYWFETLRFEVLRVSKAAANAGSRRISERQGMRLIKVEERDYVSGRVPAETWEITAEEWFRRHRRMDRMDPIL
jgi:RimJ/RimL family protein N-acetyltransferase